MMNIYTKYRLIALTLKKNNKTNITYNSSRKIRGEFFIVKSAIPLLKHDENHMNKHSSFSKNKLNLLDKS